jgi:hypothetical protein
VPQKPEVGVDGTKKGGGFRGSRRARDHNSVVALDRGIKVRLGPVGDVDAIGLDNGTEEGDALRHVPKLRLVSMQSQVEFVAEELVKESREPGEIVAVTVNKDAIVNVTAIVADAEIMLYEMIERRQVEIREYLAGEVAYRDAAAGPGSK